MRGLAGKKGRDRALALTKTSGFRCLFGHVDDGMGRLGCEVHISGWRHWQNNILHSFPSDYASRESWGGAPQACVSADGE